MNYKLIIDSELYNVTYSKIQNTPNRLLVLFAVLFCNWWGKTPLHIELYILWKTMIDSVVSFYVYVLRKWCSLMTVTVNLYASASNYNHYLERRERARNTAIAFYQYIDAGVILSSPPPHSTITKQIHIILICICCWCFFFVLIISFFMLQLHAKQAISTHSAVHPFAQQMCRYLDEKRCK